MKFVNLTIFFIVLLFVTGCDKKEKKVEIKTESEPVITQNYNVPFSLHFTDGTILNMQKTKNGYDIDNNASATMFAFFSSWCPPCQVQIPILNNIRSKFGDKLEIIGILMDDEIAKEDIENLQKDNNISYKISQGSDNKFFASSLGGVSEVPFIVIYDEKGKFFSQYFGIIPEEILTIELQRIF